MATRAKDANYDFLTTATTPLFDLMLNYKMLENFSEGTQNVGILDPTYKTNLDFSSSSSSSRIQ